MCAWKWLLIALASSIHLGSGLSDVSGAEQDRGNFQLAGTTPCVIDNLAHGLRRIEKEVEFLFLIKNVHPFNLTPDVEIEVVRQKVIVSLYIGRNLVPQPKHVNRIGPRYGYDPAFSRRAWSVYKRTIARCPFLGVVHSKTGSHSTSLTWGLANILDTNDTTETESISFKRSTLDGEISSNLSFAYAASFLHGAFGGKGSAAVNFESVSNKPDSPYAYASSDNRQDCHSPLCVRVARREFGPPVPFGRAIGFLVVFCGGGVWLAYLAIGWLTKPRDENNRNDPGDSD